MHTGEDLAEHEVVSSGKTKEELTKAIVEGLHLLFDNSVFQSQGNWTLALTYSAEASLLHDWLEACQNGQCSETD